MVSQQKFLVNLILLQMATTKEDVAAVALTLIRATPITSFSDGSNEANIITNVYSPLVQKIMTLHPWSFATKKRRLNQNSTNPVNEYNYAYIIPSEALRIFKVFDSSSVNAIPNTNYKIMGSNILSNDTTLYAEYTTYVSESYWPPYFADFMAYALAAKIALAVTDDENLAQGMQQVAFGTPGQGGRGGEFANAANIDSQQNPAQTLQPSELISFRFS